MKVLITGSSGFIGRNILEQLGSKYEFITPRSQELDLENSEAVLKYLQTNKFHLILHLANKGGTRRDLGATDTCFKNLLMFFNLVEGKEYFDRMIVLGSGAEYDKRRDIKNITEKDFGFPIPIDQYGFSKYAMAKYAESVDFITHLRLFAVYGKYEDYQLRFISNAICKTLLNMPITIKQNVYFDYIYVDDLVRIIDTIIQKVPVQVHYNIGVGLPIDLVTIAQRILQITGKNLPIRIARGGLNKEYSCNTLRFNAEFPEVRYTEFEKTLTELISYYQSFLLTLDKQIFLSDI